MTASPPEWMLYVHALLAFAFVVALIFLCAAVAKKMGLDKRLAGYKGAAPRLSVVETLYMGPKHKLVIIRSGTKEHLLLMGANGDLLIDTYEKEAPHAS